MKARKQTLWAAASAVVLLLAAAGPGCTKKKEKSPAEPGEPKAEQSEPAARLAEPRPRPAEPVRPVAAEGRAPGTEPGLAATTTSAAGPSPRVLIKTSMGNIAVELNPAKAPITVKNFLRYVGEKHYDGTIFHRVIPTFMIQGGGFTPSFNEKSTHPPIKNEATNGLEHLRGTIAMARTKIIDSATSQFFINVKDNMFLNHRGPGRLYGYTVFGKVVKGMDVVDKIRNVPTGAKGPFAKDCPLTDVVIRSIRLIAQAGAVPPARPGEGKKAGGPRPRPRKKAAPRAGR